MTSNKIQTLALHFSALTYDKPSDYALAAADSFQDKADACFAVKIVGRPVSADSMRRGRKWQARARAFRRAAEMLAASRFDTAAPAFDIGG